MSDFLEYHKILGCEIISVTRSGLESCEIPAFFISDTQNLQHSNSPTLILTDDILETIFVRKRTKKSLAKNLDLLLHISPGDYVVHREHGIARFHTVIEKTLGDIRREYIELHYA